MNRQAITILLILAVLLLAPLAGDTFSLERERGGLHARIMKTGLNRVTP